MAKLYFRYGAMNSGKSLQLLTVAYNYEEQGKSVLLLRPSIDTRTTDGCIESRLGIKKPCITINRNENIMQLIYERDLNPDVILIDESQFLTKEQVKELNTLAWEMNIAVLCYGLKNSAIDGELFEGSEALLYYADDFQEIKTTCQYCSSKANMNLKLINNKPVRDGEVVQIGDVKESIDNVKFLSVCKKHYYEYEEVK
ncbi:MAG: thymidine kinase [Veillonella parvula]|uniref:Thymidine kinase n=1 Tax=Veillonella parvula TaxID=29466 RepID=A0A942WNT5_VEIPA|nr:thymidine kinase [Veillonella parvula]MBS4894021.1 thymidine kinase [Veillonella parvula]